MIHQVIEGVAPIAKEGDIAAFLKKQPDNPYPGPPRWIGVLNEDGALYRVIVPDMPSDAIRVSKFLSRLGLVDRIGFDDATLSEIDTLTRRPISTAWAHLFQAGTTPHPIPAIPRNLA